MPFIYQRNGLLVQVHMYHTPINEPLCQLIILVVASILFLIIHTAGTIPACTKHSALHSSAFATISLCPVRCVDTTASTFYELPVRSSFGTRAVLSGTVFGNIDSKSFSSHSLQVAMKVAKLSKHLSKWQLGNVLEHHFL